MMIKTLAELAQPDAASLAIRPLDIDGANVAEGVADYRQRLVASFELIDGVPESTRNSYDRVRTIYTYGIFCYDLYTVAGSYARLVVEQALRDRFLPFYDGTVTFLDRAGGEHPVTASRFDDLYNRDTPLVDRSWRWLKLRNGRTEIPFNGMLASLLRWAREECLLGGQRDRSKDRFRVWFRNYTAHPHYHTETAGDAAEEIFLLAQLINQLWGAPPESPISRHPVAVAWTATAIGYGLAEAFQLYDRMPADTPCAILLADPRDRTLGNSFDTQYELTAHPFEFLWGPGNWADGAAWLHQQQPAGDEVTIIDRLFLLRFDQKRLHMPRSPGVAAGLSVDQRTGTWYLIRADYPLDAFNHQRHLLSNNPAQPAIGFCRECPAESIASGTWC